MGSMLKEDNGQTSSVRVAFIVNTIVAIGLSFYCIYMKQLSWEAVSLIAIYLGVTNYSKVKSKSIEKAVPKITNVSNVSHG